MVDPVNEYAVQQLNEFNSMERSCSSRRRKLGLGGEDKKVKDMKAEFKPLTRFTKEVFGDKVVMRR